MAEKGKKKWLISCDESGTGGAPFYGFGSLWMPEQRRGDFFDLVRDVRTRHRYTSEFKWNRVSRHFLPAYRDLVETFFKTSYLRFHCIVVKQAFVIPEFHCHDMDLARRKLFTLLLTNKIKRCLRAYPDREQTFRIWVDPIASRYKKADEAVERISNNVLRKVFGEVRPVDKVITHDSKDTPSIQLCDVLLGAVMETWQRKVTSAAKLELRNWIAYHLGWPELAFDTRPQEVKFNIWYFCDPKQPREAQARGVSLIYPPPDSAGDEVSADPPDADAAQAG